MFDTNALNALLDEGVNEASLPEAEYLCTNLQYAELQHTKNLARRSELTNKFSVVVSATNTERVMQRSTPWGSPWNSPWDQGGSHYQNVLTQLELRKPRDRGNSYDAVLIETCIYEGIIFVSNDSAVRDVCGMVNVRSVSLQEFLNGRRAQAV